MGEKQSWVAQVGSAGAQLDRHEALRVPGRSVPH